MKLKVIQLKPKILKLLEQLIRLWDMMLKFLPVFIVFVLCAYLWKATLLSVSQGGSCYARGYAVVNVLWVLLHGLFRCVGMRAVCVIAYKT
jgi:hypothetical protein